MINSIIVSSVIINLIVVAITIVTIIMILVRGHLVKWLGLGLWHSLCSFFLWVWLYQVHLMMMMGLALMLMMAFLESQFVFSLRLWKMRTTTCSVYRPPSPKSSFLSSTSRSVQNYY